MTVDSALSNGAIGMVCDECGQDFPHLHRHHIVARSDGGADDEANIRHLCPNCHALIHGGSFGGPTLRGRGRKKTSKAPKEKPLRLQPAHERFLLTEPVMRGINVQQSLDALLDEAMSGKSPGLRPLREIVARQQGLVREVQRQLLPAMRLLSRVIEETEEFAAQIAAPSSEPMWADGKRYHHVSVKFTVDEWRVVEALMAASNLNITDLVKTALAGMATHHGLSFPRREEAAS